MQVAFRFRSIRFDSIRFVCFRLVWRRVNELGAPLLARLVGKLAFVDFFAARLEFARLNNSSASITRLAQNETQTKRATRIKSTGVFVALAEQSAVSLTFVCAKSWASHATPARRLTCQPHRHSHRRSTNQTNKQTDRHATAKRLEPRRANRTNEQTIPTQQCAKLATRKSTLQLRRSVTQLL